MDILKRETQKSGFLNGHLLIAMPGMDDERFSRSVIYICAHSEEGAMGLILNKPRAMAFSDILLELGIINDDEKMGLPIATQAFPVRNGGPVDGSRGFVLHSDDYHCEATMPVAEHIGLTATVDILKAIKSGKGPKRALITLGYAGWDKGQLEAEIAANGWLTGPAPDDMIFHDNFENHYEMSMRALGIDPAFLVSDAGHA